MQGLTSKIHRRILPTVALALALIGGLGVGIGVGLGQELPLSDPKKIAPFPDEGLSDEERQEKINGFWERNAKWVEEFSDTGKDPSHLPASNIQTYSPGATSVSEARALSEVAVEGRVLSTVPVPNPQGSLSYSIATVEVLRSATGDFPTKTIEVIQAGGPIPTEDGKGALLQLEGDPLLLAGQHVLLLLHLADDDIQRAAGRYQTVYGAGVYLVTPSGVLAPESNGFRDQVSGRSVNEVLTLFE